MSRTIRLVVRPAPSIEEHRELMEPIGSRQANAAQEVIERHIRGALDDIVRLGEPKPAADAESRIAT